MEKFIIKIANMNKNTHIRYVSAKHVAPVAPVAPATSWPPVWLACPRVAAAPEPAITAVTAEPVVTAPEPVESLTGPCPTCGCAIGWRLLGGQVLCATCHNRPSDATRALFVDDGRGWVDYTAERDRHERRRQTPGEPDSWDDGELWTADAWRCPNCGSAEGWLSMADVFHCMKCQPPSRAERTIRKREAMLSRPPPWPPRWNPAADRQKKPPP